MGEVMMPKSIDLPIVDAHVHLWDPDSFPIPWLEGSAVLNRPYDLADFWADADGLPVEGVVYVQVEVDPVYALLEARWAVERARFDARLLAIVPWAPIERGERVRPFLHALLEDDADLVRGVRRNLQDEPDPEFCLRPDFIRGLRILPEYDLTFDICVRHSQLPAVVKMVRACPETNFVLDHLGKPPIREGRLDPWRSQIDALASLPNLSVKLSGLVTEADHDRWSPAEIAPFVLHAIDAFGEERVAFGGDWPVLLETATYRRWVGTLNDLTSGLSDSARRKLWAENARRLYRLPGTTTPVAGMQGQTATV